jgi:hypothetical protein
MLCFNAASKILLLHFPAPLWKFPQVIDGDLNQLYAIIIKRIVVAESKTAT